jgi:5-methylthioadenosine/S-adenosylhomocysteine deaminase
VRVVYGRGISTTGEASGMPAHLVESAERALGECDDLQQAWADDGMVDIWAAPYAVWALTEPGARAVAAWADRIGARVTVHASASVGQVQDAQERFGMTDLAWLEAMGLLTERTLVAHAVHLDKEGIQLLARSGAAVAHCPVSNLYGAAGVAPVPAMRQAGLRVALGTDGAASNNSQSIIETMKFAVFAQRAVGRTSVGAQDALAMATSEAAAAIGLGDRIGRLSPGYRADILLLDPRRLPIAPSHNPISDVVYAGSSSCVHTVLVDGKVVVQDGKLLTLDTASLVEEAQARADSLVRRAGLEHHRTRSRSGAA